MRLPAIEAVAAARRWSDGWRGGLLGTCDFDLGFHGAWVKEVIDRLGSDGVVLVDPSSATVDPAIIDTIIERARARQTIELCFTQAPPGLGGVLLRSSLVERLASAETHPGRLLHYQPDHPARDPIGGDGCAPIATPVARCTRNFRLDSDRRIEQLTQAAISLNGELVTSGAEELLHRLSWTTQVDPLPRDVVMELNTSRATSPTFAPCRFLNIIREPMRADLARRVLERIGSVDDVRLTIAGVGDPLLHDEVFEIIDAAMNSGVRSIHVETDLLPRDASSVDRLVGSGVDVVSVHLPAMTPQTYATVMGVDRCVEVIENMKRFVTRRHELRQGVPIVVPTFVKCSANIAEMEAWYDQWLRALGAAVIRGPSDFAGLIPDCAVADMSPPRRRACSRLWSRMSILSDGRVVSCEQDVTARQVVGDARSQTIREIWQQGFGRMRACHRSGEWDQSPACAACREWHRP
jgi:spiro-SPASM protein